MAKTVSRKEKARPGGRPSLAQAGKIEERIVDDAAELFLTLGYAATSIEAIAQRSGISKRTFYHRFDDKTDIFSAVVARLVTRLRPKEENHLFSGPSLDAILLTLAKVILRAAVSPDAIRLHRMLIGEATRIPNLLHIMETQGARQEAIDRIGAFFQQETANGHLLLKDPRFAAEQFLHMVISVPQRRAIETGAPMTDVELDHWATQTVDLFLHGCKP